MSDRSRRLRKRSAACFALVGILLAPTVVASQSRCPTPGATPPIPETISAAAAAVYKRLAAQKAASPSPAAMPTTLAGWDARRAAMEAMVMRFTPPLAGALGVTVLPMSLGSVPVLKVSPKAPGAKRILIYVHGGAFTAFSAKSTLNTAALMTSKTGLTVYSIDYTIAPHAHWREITDQVISVYRVLLKNHSPADIGMFGDSAGGSIVAGSVLKMRDLGTPMPGALVLLSPATDVADSGDTYCTLAAADPVLSATTSEPSMAAYAPPSEQKSPYVSPVYGDYTKGFPPTLIQGGTREILLSGFVREYQAIKQAGGVAVLDLYEGMPHEFQILIPDSPESTAAFSSAAQFWTAHLGKSNSSPFGARTPHKHRSSTGA